MQTRGYSDALNLIRANKNFRYAIGHTRAETKGSNKFNENNHPIVAGRVIGIHNGCIHNDDKLFAKYAEDHMRRAGQVDSEIIFRLIEHELNRSESIVGAVRLAHEQLEGSYACAFIDTENPRYVTLFRDNSWNDIILFDYNKSSMAAFASTEYILGRAMDGRGCLDPSHKTAKIEIRNGGLRLDTLTGKYYQFEFAQKPKSTGVMYDGFCARTDCGLCYYREACDKEKNKLNNLAMKTGDSSSGSEDFAEGFADFMGMGLNIPIG
jgi:hypothetical protein